MLWGSRRPPAILSLRGDPLRPPTSARRGLSVWVTVPGGTGPACTSSALPPEHSPPGRRPQSLPATLSGFPDCAHVVREVIDTDVGLLPVCCVCCCPFHTFFKYNIHLERGTHLSAQLKLSQTRHTHVTHYWLRTDSTPRAPRGPGVLPSHPQCAPRPTPTPGSTPWFRLLLRFAHTDRAVHTSLPHALRSAHLSDPQTSATYGCSDFVSFASCEFYLK